MKIVLSALTLWLALSSCLAEKAKPPKINSGFTKVVYFRGTSDQRTLECTAVGIPEPTYEWYKDGQMVTTSATVKVTGGTLELVAPDYRDAGYYQCFAVNKHGTSMSTVVHIAKGEMSGFAKTPVSDVNTRVGEHAILPCHNKPDSTPAALLDWFYSKSDAIIPSERVVIDQQGTLHFINVEERDQLADGKTYNCSVFNTVTQTRSYGNPGRLIVEAPTGPVTPRGVSIPFFTPTEDAVVLLGGIVTLQCIPDGYPLPQVRWSRVGGELPFGRHQINPKTYKLEISNVTENDEGEYKCEAYSGNDVQSQTIFVDVKSEPIWEEKMKPITITSGKTAVFDCVARSARGEQDAVQVQWFRNGVKLQPGTQGKITVSLNRLTVTNALKPRDLMNVQCNVSNTIGYQLADAYLNVIEPTRLTEEPEKSTLIDPGKSIEVRISAIADPLYASRLTYSWSKDGTPVGTNNKDYYYVNTANNLVVNATKLGNDEEFLQVLGNYSCHVSLGLGGEGDIVTYTSVASEKEEEIIAEAALDLWWIAIIVAVVVLIIIIILICCLLYRNRGGTYPVDEKERRAGHDPEKELADSGFQDLSRADAPDEKKPYGNPDQVSLTNDPPIGGDTDSLDEYGEPDSSKFNEDGSFIGNYGGRKGRDMNQSTV